MNPCGGLGDLPKTIPPPPSRKKTLLLAPLYGALLRLGFLSRFKQKGKKDLAMNMLFIIFRGWDLDLYFYSFKMPLFEILF